MHRGSVKLVGHPVHPMLVHFPLGLLPTSVLFDALAWMTGAREWATMAFVLTGAGVLGGLLAAAFGWADWLRIPRGTRAKVIGLWHGLGNALVLLLFGASWLVRLTDGEPGGILGPGLSVAGLVLALGTAWLGGELVVRFGIGVDAGAHPDRPPSGDGVRRPEDVLVGRP